MTSNLLGHEVACMRDMTGGHGKLHHLAFYFGTGQHLADAVEMFRDYDVQIEAGPDKPGVTKASSSTCSSRAATASSCSARPATCTLTRTRTPNLADVGDRDRAGSRRRQTAVGDLLHLRHPEPAPLDQHIESTRTWARGGARFGGAGSRAADPGRDRPLTRCLGFLAV